MCSLCTQGHSLILQQLSHRNKQILIFDLRVSVPHTVRYSVTSMSITSLDQEFSTGATTTCQTTYNSDDQHYSICSTCCKFKATRRTSRHHQRCTLYEWTYSSETSDYHFSIAKPRTFINHAPFLDILPSLCLTSHYLLSISPISCVLFPLSHISQPSFLVPLLVFQFFSFIWLAPYETHLLALSWSHDL